MMTALLISALTLGFLGSFHCIGMCGPIALSLPVQHLSGFRKVLGILIYNSGRAVTYFLLGVAFGSIGMSFQFFGWQQVLSIGLGILLIFIFISSLVGKRYMQSSPFLKKWNQELSSLIVPLFHRKGFDALFIIGTLNGLLPCGLVYMAVAGALATGDILSSGLFMAAFGLGTMPAMMATSFAAGMVTLKMRNQIRKSFPYLLGLMGILLLLRGMNLGIPYLSPVLEHSHAAANCH